MPEVNLVTCSRLQARMRIECLDFTSAHGNLMEGGNAAHVDDSPGAEGAFKQGEFVVVSRHNGNPIRWCGLVGAILQIHAWNIIKSLFGYLDFLVVLPLKTSWFFRRAHVGIAFSPSVLSLDVINSDSRCHDTLLCCYLHKTHV